MDPGNVTGSQASSGAGGAQATDPDVQAAESAAAEAAKLARQAAEAAAEAARAQAERALELQAKAQELAAKADAASKRASAAAARLEEKVETRFAKGQKIPPALQKAAERAANLAQAAKASASKAHQGANAATAAARGKSHDRFVALKDRQLDGATTAGVSKSKPAPAPATQKPVDAARERYADAKDRQLAQPEERAGEQLRAQAGALEQVYSAQPEKWERTSRQLGLPQGTAPSKELLERVLTSQVQGDVAAAVAQHRVRSSMGGSARPGELVGAETQAMSLARMEAAHRNGVLAIPQGADAKAWMQGQAELAGAAENIRQSAVRGGRDPERAVAESQTIFEMRLDVALRSGEFSLGEGVTPEQVAAFKQGQVTNFKDAVRISQQRGIPVEDALSRVNDCRALQQHRIGTVDAINGMMDNFNTHTTPVTRGMEAIRGNEYQDGVYHLDWAHREVKDIEALEARYVDLRMNHSAQELTPEQRQELQGLETEIHGRLNTLGQQAELHIDHSLQHANNSQWFEQALFSTVYTAASFVPFGVVGGAATKLLLDDMPNGRVHNGLDALGSVTVGAGNVLVGKLAPGNGVGGLVRMAAAQGAWSGASNFYEQAKTGQVDAVGVVGSMASGFIGGLIPGEGPGPGATWRNVVGSELRNAAGNFATSAVVDGGMQLASTGQIDLGHALAAGRDDALTSGLGSAGMAAGRHLAGRRGVVAASGGQAGAAEGLPPGQLSVQGRSTEAVRRELARLLLDGDARVPVQVDGAQHSLTLGEISKLPTERAFAVYHDPEQGTVRLQQISTDGSTASTRAPLAAYQQGALPGEVLLGGLHQHPAGSSQLDVPASSADLNHDAALRAALGPQGDHLQMFILRHDSGRPVLTEYGGAPSRLSAADGAARDAALIRGLVGEPGALPMAATPSRETLAALSRLQRGAGAVTAGAQGEQLASLRQRVLTDEAGGNSYRLGYTAERTGDGLVLRLDENKGQVPAAALAADLEPFGLPPEAASALMARLKSASPGDLFWAGPNQLLHFGNSNDFHGVNIAGANLIGGDLIQRVSGGEPGSGTPRVSVTEDGVGLDFGSNQQYAHSNIAVFNVVGRDIVCIGSTNAHLNIAGRDIVALRVGPGAFAEQSVGQRADRDIIDVRVKTDLDDPAVMSAASRLFDTVRTTPRDHLAPAPPLEGGTGLIAGRDRVDLQVDLTGMSPTEAVRVLDAAGKDYVRRSLGQAPATPGATIPTDAQQHLIDKQSVLESNLGVLDKQIAAHGPDSPHLGVLVAQAVVTRRELQAMGAEPGQSQRDWAAENAPYDRPLEGTSRLHPENKAALDGLRFFQGVCLKVHEGQLARLPPDAPSRVLLETQIAERKQSLAQVDRALGIEGGRNWEAELAADAASLAPLKGRITAELTPELEFAAGLRDTHGRQLARLERQMAGVPSDGPQLTTLKLLQLEHKKELQRLDAELGVVGGRDWKAELKRETPPINLPGVPTAALPEGDRQHMDQLRQSHATRLGLLELQLSVVSPTASGRKGLEDQRRHELESLASLDLKLGIQGGRDWQALIPKVPRPPSVRGGMNIRF